MKVLVTGGAGYVGSHTCQVIAEQGITPITLDNLSRGFKENVLWGPLHQIDLLETDKIADLLKKEKIESVFHFAAHATVGESIRDPLAYYQNNVMGSLSLLQAMKKAGASKIVFSSTCATYGLPEQLPIEENCSQRPINPYGRTKLMVEMLLKDYVKAHQFSAVALRYFNASGADQKTMIGEKHHPETRLIPLVLEAGHKNQEIHVFGDDYATEDGTCVRDYIHVTDLGEAHLLALKYIEKNPGFEDFNLGTGRGYSVKTIIQTVEQVTGKKVKQNIIGRREGDPPVLVSSEKKAEKILKWKPRHSDIKNIIETANQWYLKTNNG